MLYYNQKGQTLVIVLLVMILALATGLIVSNRVIQGFKRSVKIDSSVRALGVAEALVERILTLNSGTLDDYIANNSCGSACQLIITGSDGITATAQATLSHYGNSTNQLDVKVEKNATYEVDLTGYSSSSTVELCWDDAASGDNPSVYVSYVHGASPYSLSKYAYNAASTLHGSNGFSTAASDLSYPNCFTVPAKTTPLFLRVRAIYNDINLHVIPKGGSALPIQGYVITATGAVSDVVKTVTALKTKPYLPSEFDFAIFSTSDDTPLQN